MNIILNDFKPINNWKVDTDGPKWKNSKEPAYLIDQSTGRKYWNESKGTVRVKCFLLTLGTPIVHAVASAINVAYRILKLVSFSHFWMPKKKESSYNFKARLGDAGKDLLRVITQPWAILGLTFTAIYGVFSPYDGRKLYATIERAQYGHFILAPCFQPSPEKHFFGGNPQERNAW